MISKLLIFVSCLTVIVSMESGDDWWCETSATPCGEHYVAVAGVGKVHQPQATCMDKNKQKYTNSLHNIWHVGDSIAYESRCSDDSTPCILAFKLCVQDMDNAEFPPVMLKCRYLKDFEDTECSTSKCSENSKCGPRGAKQHIHLLKGPHGPALVIYSCEKFQIKAISSETESKKE